MDQMWLRKTWTLALGLMLACLIPHGKGFAAEPSGQTAQGSTPVLEQTVLRVAALNNPPYVSTGPHGLEGLSIDAFKIIAAQNHWKVRYILERNRDDMTNAMITNQADIGIGGITPTPELSLVVDFSDANEIVPLALVVKEEGHWTKLLHSIERIGTILVNGPMLLLVAIGIISVLVAGYFVRLIERAHNSEMFPENFRHNAWWAAQTLVAHNCGNKLPFSERGRYIAIILMLGGTVFTAEVTAVLTTSLAASIESNAPITGIGDVGNRRIATIEGSFAKDWLEQNGVNIQTYNRFHQCLTALESGQVAGVAFDKATILRALNTGRYKDLKIVGDTFGSHPHAFMLRKRSPYLTALNQSVESLLTSQQWTAMHQHWIGSLDHEAPPTITDQ